RPPAGTEVAVDLDLTADQASLRDGITSLLAGRFDSDRIRAGFDRAAFDELAEAGVFSLRADGFSWSDCTVVFEQLGRFCVPGPLVASLLLGDRRVAPPVEPAGDGSAWVEYLDVLDDLYVLRGAELERLDPRGLDADPSTWPLDPLTPIARVPSLPAGEPVATDVGDLRRPGAA